MRDSWKRYADVNGLECYSGNEGLSFGGEDHLIRNVFSHGFYNHGCKVNERYENSTLENLVCYNNLEGMHWVNCQKNIVLRHSTIDGTVMIQGQYDTAAACADGSTTGQWNLDIFNSNLVKISYNDPYGMDPRAVVNHLHYPLGQYPQATLWPSRQEHDLCRSRNDPRQLVKC